MHYASNETIGGLQFDWVPQTGDVPLVVDMSSDILSRPIDVSQFGLIYAGAQKNIGPSGLVVVIVREDLLGHARSSCPTMLDYKVSADNGSMYNTPATYSWYLSGLVFEWLKEQGGVEAMEQRNRAKKDRLYGFIDSSRFYTNPISVNARSWMNVPFRLADERLDKAFLAGADARGLLNLKGHRSVGGMRAPSTMPWAWTPWKRWWPTWLNSRSTADVGTGTQSPARSHRQPRRKNPRADQRARPVPKRLRGSRPLRSKKARSRCSTARARSSAQAGDGA